MRLFQSFLLALKNILTSKVRSVLTMLGIIIGVSGVMVYHRYGQRHENYMKDSFKSLGTDLLTVNIVGTGTSRKVDVEDMYRLAADNPCI
jgi:putative ABC transport system permease protein